MHRVPHYDRLLSLLEESTQRVVELWGWRGTGKRAFLAQLVECEAERTQVLTEATRSREGELDRQMAEGRLRGVRWIVMEESAEPVDLSGVLPRLHPDQSLVVAVRRRGARAGQRRRNGGAPSLGTLTDTVPPESLLLAASEVAELWRDLRGTTPSGGVVRRLIRETEGWLRPLELLARESDSPESAIRSTRSAVRRFLQIEVLEPLSPEEREAMAAIAAGRPVSGAEEVVLSLVADWGLVWDGPDGLRLPSLLALYFDELGEGSTRARPGPAKQPPRPTSGRDGRAASDVVEVRLLGPPELQRHFADGGVAELEWSLRRAFLALAFLASTADKQATRADLVEAVWSEADAETVRRNFHPTISLLRRTLRGPGREGPQAILYSGGYYRLSPQLTWRIDLDEFRALVELGRNADDDEERVSAWIAAWRSYRGHYLPGFDLAWVVARRDEILRSYLDMLRELGSALLRLGRAREAEDVLRTALVEDPLQEEVYVTIMRIYAERGRRDLVRRQYERLCQVLLAELGLEPLAVTAAEYQRLMG